MVRLHVPQPRNNESICTPAVILILTGLALDSLCCGTDGVGFLFISLYMTGIMPDSAESEALRTRQREIGTPLPYVQHQESERRLDL